MLCVFSTAANCLLLFYSFLFIFVLFEHIRTDEDDQGALSYDQCDKGENETDRKEEKDQFALSVVLLLVRFHLNQSNKWLIHTQLLCLLTRVRNRFAM